MSPALSAILRRLEDPTQLHTSAVFGEALARLHFAVEHRQQLAALLGISGVGKSTLLRTFRRELLALPVCVVQLGLAGLNEHDLRQSLAQQMGTANNWLRICQRITELGYDNTSLVLLADEAHRALPESLDFLARLWNADPLGQARITLVLATEELALAQMSSSWLDRIDLRVELDLWTLADFSEYMNRIVGEESERGFGFEPEALDRIHQLAGGLPRQLCRLAQLSLLAAEGQERQRVDEATVTGVSHELCRPMPLYHDGPAIEFVDELSS